MKFKNKLFLKGNKKVEQSLVRAIKAHTGVWFIVTTSCTQCEITKETIKKGTEKLNKNSKMPIINSYQPLINY